MEWAGLSIDVACWLVFLLYWIATARAVKRTKEVKVGFGYARFLIFIVVFLLLKVSGAAGHAAATLLLPHSDILMIVSALFNIAGVVIAIAARRKLAGNWSSDVVLKEDHELITSGLYRYVRHPIYSGIVLMALGTALGQGTVAAMAVLVLVLAFLAYKASQEEELLTKHFPAEYPAYKHRVKAIVPYVW